MGTILAIHQRRLVSAVAVSVTSAARFRTRRPRSPCFQLAIQRAYAFIACPALDQMRACFATIFPVTNRLTAPALDPSRLTHPASLGTLPPN